MTDGTYEEVEHTADWALRVRAPDARRLLQAAARGMFRMLAPAEDVPEKVRATFELEAPDLETLLIDWLNELLFRAEVDGIAWHTAQVDAVEGAGDTSEGPWRLRAAATGGPPRRPLQKAIKAATFNDLAVRETPSGLEATVVFDV